MCHHVTSNPCGNTLKGWVTRSHVRPPLYCTLLPTLSMSPPTHVAILWKDGSPGVMWDHHHTAPYFQPSPCHLQPMWQYFERMGHQESCETTIVLHPTSNPLHYTSNPCGNTLKGWVTRSHVRPPSYCTLLPTLSIIPPTHVAILWKDGSPGVMWDHHRTAPYFQPSPLHLAEQFTCNQLRSLTMASAS